MPQKCEIGGYKRIKSTFRLRCSSKIGSLVRSSAWLKKPIGRDAQPNIIDLNLAFGLKLIVKNI